LLWTPTQGVQAQTLVNAYLAVNENLTIIPVINRLICRRLAFDDVAMEIEQTLGFKAEGLHSGLGQDGAGDSASCWRRSATSFRRRGRR